MNVETKRSNAEEDGPNDVQAEETLPEEARGKSRRPGRKRRLGVAMKLEQATDPPTRRVDSLRRKSTQ